MFLRTGSVSVAAIALCFMSTSIAVAFDPKDSADFPHSLEFDVDGELPSVEGAADSWEETGWNFGGAPSLEVSGGTLQFNSFSAADTAAGTPWVHMDGASAWEAEIDGATSYTLEMEVQVDADIGGMIIWAGNGSNRLLLHVGTGSISADGPGGELDTGDNSAAPIILRIAYDGGASTYDIYRNDVLVGDDIAASAGDGNNRLILFDCCGSTAARGVMEYLRWTATGAHDTGTASTTFDHALEFETDGELPSVEGAADGWAEVNGWNIAGLPPSLDISGGIATARTVGVGGGHWLAQPVNTSAWAAEVDPGTSYTFETRVRILDQAGTQPGFSIWLGNGTASETAVVQVRTNEVMYGTSTQTLHEGDNSTDFVTIRIAHDGPSGLHTVYRNDIEIGSDLGPSDLQHGNNWIILIDFGGANEVDAEIDYICWDATGAYPPAGGGPDTDAPAAPTGLSASTGVGAVALDWDSNTEDDVVGYNVYRSETPGDGAGLGGYDLIGEGVGSSDFSDDGLVDGTEYFYVVTAVDASENESDPSGEISATPGFGAERDPDTFDHCLNFDVDDELPSVEGAADGWAESATWNADKAAPTLSVSGGLLHFSSALPGQHSVDQPDNGTSAWSSTINGSTSYTFEASVRTISATGGTVFWLANGGNRLIVIVGTNTVTTLGGLELHEGDNSSRLVTIRVGYDGVSGLYYVWRNGILIGDGVPPGADTGRKAIFLIDCCSSIIAEGELDYVCWEATGLYPPATIIDETPPAAPTGLAAAGSFGAVGLDWDTNGEDDLANYNVYRSESAGGPFDLLAEAVTSSAHIDSDVVNGTEYFYVVTAVDGSGNESNDSEEASATPHVPPELGAAAFPHCLFFEENGVLPSVEGAEDGWMEDAPWNQNEPDPPSLTVFDGRLSFESILAGQQSITMQDGSAWANEIDPSTSYTFEVSLRVVAGSGDNPGATLWLANGATRMVLHVGTTGVSTLLNGTELDDGDNSAEFVTIRTGYNAVSGLYYVWRNGVLIGDGLPDEGAAANGRTAVFLIDCCSSVQVAGEFEHVCWTAGELFSPDLVAPADPTGLAAVAGEGQVALDWDDNGEGDLAGYDVLRSESAGGPYDVVGFAGSSDHVDSSVVNGLTYFYVVAAVDTSGNASAVSNEANATPIAPGGLQIPGDCNQDRSVDLSDAACLFGFLFTGLTDELPCGDGSLGHPANVALIDWNGDDEIDISDGSALLNFLFLGGPPHGLGLECIRVEDCEQDVCTP